MLDLDLTTLKKLSNLHVRFRFDNFKKVVKSAFKSTFNL